MAKRETKQWKSIDEMFTEASQESRPKRPRRAYAVRQIRGPRGKHFPAIAVLATGPTDAQRSWFDYHGLNMETYRYNLQVLRLPDDHPAAKNAVQISSPRNPHEMTLEQQMEATHEAVESMVGSGEAEAFKELEKAGQE